MGVIQTSPLTERIPGPFPLDRICKVPTCDQELSAYNEKDICNACWLEQMPPEEREG